MKIYKTVRGLQRALEVALKSHKKIGFIPTMGALHKGHISLLKNAQTSSDITVFSIFVNPTQFNEKADLQKYPRTLKADADLLRKYHCDFLFVPRVSQIYPKGIDLSVDLDLSQLTQHMEGPNRPGHFEGVVQVVHRLVTIVNPDLIYMGQKDFQQFTIVDYMLRSLKMKTKLVVCPIKREDDGLAMSSRNVRILKSIRPNCHLIYDTLKFVKDNLNKYTAKTLEKKALDRLNQKPFKPEYFSLVDGFSLKPVKKITDHSYIVACTAVWAKDVRLIDNMILKN